MIRSARAACVACVASAPSWRRGARSASIHTLRPGISDHETPLETATSCLADDEPVVRIAAIHLLSRLV